MGFPFKRFYECDYNRFWLHFCLIYDVLEALIKLTRHIKRYLLVFCFLKLKIFAKIINKKKMQGNATC
jgi:hypothetical protein